MKEEGYTQKCQGENDNCIAESQVSDPKKKEKKKKKRVSKKRRKKPVFFVG